MKTKFLLFLLPFLITGTLIAQTSGGPDTYGYTWKNSADTNNGPAYKWKNIKDIGAQIKGFGDDNQVGPFNLNWNFHYYWYNYNQIWLGSNGWVSFQNIGNIAAPFPTIPTAATPNNFLAPLMCDFTFNQSNNAAIPGTTVWYWSNNKDTSIIQYDSIPYWVNSANGYSGRYTFQVILSGVDSSITYQYKITQTGSVPYDMTSEKLTTGIENATGQIGLQVLTNKFPTANTAVKFYYPKQVTYKAYDATPAWNQNSANGGFFVSAKGKPIKLKTDIANVGNQTNDSITVQGSLYSMTQSSYVWNDTGFVSTLKAGSDTVLTYPVSYADTAAGTYMIRATSIFKKDVNTSNDLTTTEMVVVDTTKPNIALSYTSGTPTAQSGFLGNGGEGIYIEPPFYPATITSVDFFVTNSDTISTHLVNIVDDDGPGNTPGTLLYSTSVKAKDAVKNTYNNIPVTKPVVITSGGIYVGWLENGDDSSAIGADGAAPLSYRNYEISNGTWSSYRSNTTNDLMIRVNINAFGAITTSVTADGCPSSKSGTASVNVTGGATPFTYSWSTTPPQTTATATGLAAGVYNVTITNANGSTQTASVFVPNTLTVSIASSTAVTCYGVSNGSATASISGSGPFGYLWSPGSQTTETASNLSAGTYTVTGSNSQGCVNKATVTINSPTDIIVSTSTSVASCLNIDGTAISSVTGGTPKYYYSWSTTPVQTTSSAIGLSAGEYTLTVTDSVGCVDISTVTITNTKVAITTSLTPTNCAGTGGGSATVTAATGGIAPYTYLWYTNPNQTSATATGLSASTYSVLTKDSQGCSSTSSVTITRSKFIIALTKTAISCNGGSDGSETATAVSGGLAPYTYLWNSTPVQTTQTATGLSVGNYKAIITDSQGCTASDNMVLPDPILLTSSITSHPGSCPTCTNGDATVNASGGSAPYTYLWSPGNLTTMTITGIVPGDYTICVTDAHGCKKCDSVKIKVDGINEINTMAHVSINPNPFNSSASVAVDFVNPIHHNLSFSIFDIYGREVQSTDLKEYKGATIHFSINRGENMTCGMYFYRLKDDKNILSAGKILIQ